VSEAVHRGQASLTYPELGGRIQVTQCLPHLARLCVYGVRQNSRCVPPGVRTPAVLNQRLGYTNSCIQRGLVGPLILTCKKLVSSCQHRPPPRGNLAGQRHPRAADASHVAVGRLGATRRDPSGGPRLEQGRGGYNRPVPRFLSGGRYCWAWIEACSGRQGH
jgi:hypothetical protein